MVGLAGKASGDRSIKTRNNAPSRTLSKSPLPHKRRFDSRNLSFRTVTNSLLFKSSSKKAFSGFFF